MHPARPGQPCFWGLGQIFWGWVSIASLHLRALAAPGTPVPDLIATNRAMEAIASRHGEGPVAGKIQAHVIVAAG
jgi:hypothetical protein